MTRRGTSSRKPAKTKHRKRTMPKRTHAAMAASRADLSVSNLQEQLKRQTRELEEARDERAALAEVLRVNSSSAGELKPVYNAVLESAVSLCEAKFGVLYRYDGNLFHPEALIGTPQALIEFHRKRGAFQTVPGTPLHKLWQTRKVVHTADDAGGPSAPARLAGARSHLRGTHDEG